jgi:YfiH family protein
MENPPSSSSSSSWLESTLLREAGFRHAFFTRCGGVSEPPWDSLNFAISVGDAPESVRRNLAHAATALGVEPRCLYMLSQVHGTASRVLLGDEDPDEVVRSIGDITLSRAPRVACCVRSADCVPVLVADRASGAALAVHSGWRGTVARAATAGIAALRALIDGEGDLVAAIGPHIASCCFEVGDDVARALAECSSAGEGAVLRGDAKPRVDLRRILRAQLQEARLAAACIDDVPGCTVCEPARFHSYRRDGARSGRMLSAIVPSSRSMT